MLRNTVVDYPLAITALLLSLFGVAMVYSAGQTDVVTFVAPLWKSQLTWLVIAIACAWAIGSSSVRIIEWGAWPAYLLSCLLLLSLLVIGKGGGTAASTRSWIAIGGHRLGQPSELMKLTVVLMLARVLASRAESPNSLADLWKPILTVGVPWLVIMLQPDLGTGIVFIGIFFVMLFWAGTPWPLLVLLASPVISLVLSFSTMLWGAWFFVLLALVLRYRPYLVEGISLLLINIVVGVFAPVVWERLAPYQRNRLLVFLDPSVDPRNAGYHVIQSKVAIGSGGLLGSGFLMGPQKRLAFLPEQHTDFIFSVVGEELGPEVLHLLRLGEEAVPADVEHEAVVFDRAADAADVNRVFLDHDDRRRLLGQAVSRGEAGGPGADHENVCICGHARRDPRGFGPHLRRTSLRLGLSPRAEASLEALMNGQFARANLSRNHVSQHSSPPAPPPLLCRTTNRSGAIAVFPRFPAAP